MEDVSSQDNDFLFRKLDTLLYNSTDLDGMRAMKIETARILGNVFFAVAIVVAYSNSTHIFAVSFKCC